MDHSIRGTKENYASAQLLSLKDRFRKHRNPGVTLGQLSQIRNDHLECTSHSRGNSTKGFVQQNREMHSLKQYDPCKFDQQV